MFWSMFDSPIGGLLLESSGAGLSGVHMPPSPGDHDIPEGWIRNDDEFADVSLQLREYFAGTRTAFELDLDPVGTDFQRMVWRALLDIPYGTTQSYGEVARRIGRPKAVRAVGAANNRNPISIVVPCHRVIGADGSLVGFGGGLERKRALLALESRQQRMRPLAEYAMHSR